MRQQPQAGLYGMALDETGLRIGGAAVLLRPGAAPELRESIAEAAAVVGLNPETVARRLETGAANAWEERGGFRADLFVIAGRRRLDLRGPAQARKMTEELDGFCAKAEALIGHARVAGAAGAE